MVTGFEPLDVLEGIRRVRAPARGRPRRGGERLPARGRAPRATVPAQEMLDEVFEVCDRQWRGIGMIPASGWRLARRVRRRSTPSAASTSATLHSEESRALPRGRGAAGLIKPTSARRSARSARRARRSARPWSRARARARRTTTTAGSIRPWQGVVAEAPSHASVDIEGWSCPLPLRDQDRIVMGHGGGGQLSAELVEHLFLPAFGDGCSNGHAHRRRTCSTVGDGCGWRSPPTPTSCGRCSSPAATSATSPSTARSTTWR